MIWERSNREDRRGRRGASTISVTPSACPFFASPTKPCTIAGNTIDWQKSVSHVPCRVSCVTIHGMLRDMYSDVGCVSVMCHVSHVTRRVSYQHQESWNHETCHEHSVADNARVTEALWGEKGKSKRECWLRQRTRRGEGRSEGRMNTSNSSSCGAGTVSLCSCGSLRSGKCGDMRANVPQIGVRMCTSATSSEQHTLTCIQSTWCDTVAFVWGMPGCALSVACHTQNNVTPQLHFVFHMERHGRWRISSSSQLHVIRIRPMSKRGMSNESSMSFCAACLRKYRKRTRSCKFGCVVGFWI